jgi:hypothetical protein
VTRESGAFRLGSNIPNQNVQATFFPDAGERSICQLDSVFERFWLESFLGDLVVKRVALLAAFGLSLFAVVGCRNDKKKDDMRAETAELNEFSDLLVKITDKKSYDDNLAEVKRLADRKQARAKAVDEEWKSRPEPSSIEIEKNRQEAKELESDPDFKELNKAKSRFQKEYRRVAALPGVGSEFRKVAGQP